MVLNMLVNLAEAEIETSEKTRIIYYFQEITKDKAKKAVKLKSKNLLSAKIAASCMQEFYESQLIVGIELNEEGNIKEILARKIGHTWSPPNVHK